ncbi:MAG: hypothetical protein ACI30W_06740 [Muribaculaceae bacterium]
MTDTQSTTTPSSNEPLEGRYLYQSPDIQPVEHLAATPPPAKHRSRSFWQKLKLSNDR